MRSVDDVFSPARLGPVTLRNRVIKSATFEGRTPEALVTDDLIDFHAELGRGGVGMTTVAYVAHVAGFVAGFLYTMAVAGRRRAGPPPPSAPPPDWQRMRATAPPGWGPRGPSDPYGYRVAGFRVAAWSQRLS